MARLLEQLLALGANRALGGDVLAHLLREHPLALELLLKLVHLVHEQILVVRIRLQLELALELGDLVAYRLVGAHDRVAVLLHLRDLLLHGVYPRDELALPCGRHSEEP